MRRLHNVLIEVSPDILCLALTQPLTRELGTGCTVWYFQLQQMCDLNQRNVSKLKCLSLHNLTIYKRNILECLQSQFQVLQIEPRMAQEMVNVQLLFDLLVSSDSELCDPKFPLLPSPSCICFSWAAWRSNSSWIICCHALESKSDCSEEDFEVDIEFEAEEEDGVGRGGGLPTGWFWLSMEPPLSSSAGDAPKYGADGVAEIRRCDGGGICPTTRRCFSCSESQRLTSNISNDFRILPATIAL